MKTHFSSIEPLEARIAPATIIVTNNADSGMGSLRAALALADDVNHPGHDTIVFHLPANELTSDDAFVIKLTSGALTSLGNVTVTGPGAGKLIIKGDGSDRVLFITDGHPGTDSPATISGLSIIGGKATEGAGIFSYESLTLKNVVLSGNSATAYGGAVGIAGNTSLTKISISNSIITGNTGVNDGALDLNDLKSLTITNTLISGNTASDAASFGGGLDTQVGNNDAVTITGCTISNNSAGKGGGVFLNGSDSSKFTITNTIITGNAATGASSGFGGGGIFIPFGNAVISGSTISNNSAEEGGGIDANGTNSLTISNCTISGNTASDVGGGFNLSVLASLKITGTAITGNTDTSTVHGAGGGSATLGASGTGMMFSKCTFSGNTADHGGGLFVNSYATSPTAKIAISASKITGNTAVGTHTGEGGGGLYVYGGNAVVTGSTISYNTAVYDGGGIEAKGTNFASLTISKCTTSGNQTTKISGVGLGGGVFIEGNSSGEIPVMVIGSHFIGNHARNSGGGIYASDGVALTISSSTFSGNYAYDGGAGLDTEGSGMKKVDLTVTGGTFSDNVASTSNGGGIEAGGDGSVSVTGSKLTGNSAADGGGIAAFSSGQVTLTNVVVTGNFATFDGGGLEIGTPGLKIIGGSFTGNAAADGGGIWLSGTAGSILGAAISGNVATDKGGGVFETGSDNDITLQIAKVTANTAPTGPDIFGVFTPFP